MAPPFFEKGDNPMTIKLFVNKYEADSKLPNDFICITVFVVDPEVFPSPSCEIRVPIEKKNDLTLSDVDKLVRQKSYDFLERILAARCEIDPQGSF